MNEILQLAKTFLCFLRFFIKGRAINTELSTSIIFLCAKSYCNGVERYSICHSFFYCCNLFTFHANKKIFDIHKKLTG